MELDEAVINCITADSRADQEKSAEINCRIKRLQVACAILSTLRARGELPGGVRAQFSRQLIRQYLCILICIPP